MAFRTDSITVFTVTATIAEVAAVATNMADFRNLGGIAHDFILLTRGVVTDGGTIITCIFK